MTNEDVKKLLKEMIAAHSEYSSKMGRIYEKVMKIIREENKQKEVDKT